MTQTEIPKALILPARQWDDLRRLAVWQESVPGWLEMPEKLWDDVAEYISDSFERAKASGHLPEDAEVMDVETARGGRLVAIVQDESTTEHRVKLLRKDREVTTKTKQRRRKARRLRNREDVTMPKARSQTFSIFGQIEEAVATVMLTEGKGRQIPTTEFPDEALCPAVWQDELGRRAKFAVLFTPAELSEFNQRVELMRS
jgi:hypothetical protein